MLHNYKSYTIILESKARDKKINKVKEKIKKFANIPAIYNWSIEKCINDKSTEGLQYAVWIANYMKIYVVDGLMDSIGMDHKSVSKERINKFIKLGEESDNELKNIIKDAWTDISDVVVGFQEAINEDVNYVLDWLKSPLRDEKVNLSELTFKQAYDKSDEWHNSLKATGKITDESGKVIIEFDDGSYWIDLQTTYSEDEANAMGHCGNTNDGDTLLSYRDKNKSPHVTVAFDSEDGAIYQMKGRQNKKPVDKYHPYIYRLLVDPTLKPKYFAYEYLKEEDFNMSDFDKETFKKVFDYNPGLVYESIQYDSDLCKGLVKKKFLNKDEVKDVLANSTGSEELFLDLLDDELFSTEEMKELYKTLDFNFDDFSILPIFMLYDEGIMSKEQFVKEFPELSIGEKNDIIYVELEESHLGDMCDDGIIEILFGDFDYQMEWYKMERSEYIWEYLTKETKYEVIKKMIGEEFSCSHWQMDDELHFENLTITKDMIKFGDDYYLLYKNNKYKITDILDDDEDNYLYEKLSNAWNMVQESANRDEYYKMAYKALEDELGVFIKKEKKTNNNVYYNVFYFVLDDIISISTMTDILKESVVWQGKLDYNYNDYDNVKELIKENQENIISINDDYGVYGDIDSSTANEVVIDQLYFD